MICIYKQLTILEYFCFKELVLPCYRKSIADEMCNGKCTAIGAYCDDEIAGIAVLMHGSANDSISCSLHTIHVKEAFHNSETGAGLMEHVLERARSLRAETVYLNYARRTRWSEHVDTLSKDAGFTIKDEFEVYSIPFNHRELKLNTEYLSTLVKRRDTDIKSIYSLTPFSELSDDQEQRIKSGLNVWYNHEVDPFSGATKANPFCSLVLFKGEEIAGWSDVRDLDCRTVLFNTLFIKENSRGTGCFIHLLNESFQKLKGQSQITRGMFKTNKKNVIMCSTMPKLLEPFYATSKYTHVYKKMKI